MGGAQLAQLLGGRIRAHVVESHAVAQASVLHEAPEAWCFVARLRARRHGADLDEGVAQGAHAQDGFGVLVHAGRQARREGSSRWPSMSGTSTPPTMRVGRRRGSM